MNTKSQTVLITGASGGIGYELAKLFARNRHNLVLVARNAERLSEVATELNHFGITVKTVPLDLAAPPAPTFLFDQLKREPPQSINAGREQKAVIFGGLIADGFLIVEAERKNAVENFGRVLMEQARGLGVGERVS